jgi:hypothetical protein
LGPIPNPQSPIPNRKFFEIFKSINKVNISFIMIINIFTIKLNDSLASR